MLSELNFESKEKIERILERLELEKTYPPLLTKMLETLEENARIFRRDFIKLRTQITKKLDDLEEYILAVEYNDTNKQFPIGAVDGSFFTSRVIGNTYIALIGISQVLFSRGTSDIKMPEVNIGVFLERFRKPRSTHPEDFVSIKMLLLETKAIHSFSSLMNHGFLFIDGPIIDPPNYEDSSYIEYRVQSLLGLLEKGIIPIGFVKRIDSNQFSKRFMKLNDELHDQDILPIIFNSYYTRKNIPLDRALLTKPFQIGQDNPIWIEYEKSAESLGKEISLWITYAQLNYGLRPIRLEILIDQQLNAEKALDLMESIVKICKMWLLPGLQYPLPIHLAHETCRIRKRVGQFVVSKIISRILAEQKDIDTIITLKELIEE